MTWSGIDTADGYSEGRSEEIVGSWLKGRTRHDLVVASKVRFGSGTNRRGLSRKHLLDAVDGTLRRLGTDYVDLYQLHMWDYGTPVAAPSCNASWTCAGPPGWETPVSLQPLYNLLDREAEWELLPVCREEGLGVLPYSPLRGGWLTGKFRRGATPAGTDTRIGATSHAGGPVWTEAWDNYANDRTWNVVEALTDIARENGLTPAQTALNSAHWTSTLDPRQRARLDEVSDRAKPYPYQLLEDLREV